LGPRHADLAPCGLVASDPVPPPSLACARGGQRSDASVPARRGWRHAKLSRPAAALHRCISCGRPRPAGAGILEARHTAALRDRHDGRGCENALLQPALAPLCDHRAFGGRRSGPSPVPDDGGAPHRGHQPGPQPFRRRGRLAVPDAGKALGAEPLRARPAHPWRGPRDAGGKA